MSSSELFEALRWFVPQPLQHDLNGFYSHLKQLRGVIQQRYYTLTVNSQGLELLYYDQHNTQAEQLSFTALKRLIDAQMGLPEWTLQDKTVVFENVEVQLSMAF